MIQNIQLGKTNERISKYCLGTMYFGTKVNIKSSIDIMDRYYLAGGRFLDTANKYASWIPGFKGGESETLIGKWMKADASQHLIRLKHKPDLRLSIITVYIICGFHSGKVKHSEVGTAVTV